MKPVGTVLVLIVGIALGAGVMRYYDTHRPAPNVVAQGPAPAAAPASTPLPARVANVNFEKEPLWA